MNMKLLNSQHYLLHCHTLMLAQQPDATVTRGIINLQLQSLMEKKDANVDASDAGAQRPIFLKTTSISPFAGLIQNTYTEIIPYLQLIN